MVRLLSKNWMGNSSPVPAIFNKSPLFPQTTSHFCRVREIRQMVHKKGVEQKMVFRKKKCVRADNRNLFRVSMFPIVGLFLFYFQKAENVLCFSPLHWRRASEWH